MQKIAILYDASQVVLSTFDLDQVLKRILTIARDYFHLHSAAILMLDKEANELYVRQQIGRDDGYEGTRFPWGVGTIGVAAKKKRPIPGPDFTVDPRSTKFAKDVRSELAIPLMLRDEVVGVLDCQSDQPAHFDPETTDLLTLFSTQASIALQNAQLYSLEQQRASQLRAINTIAQQMTAMLAPKELLTRVCLKIQEEFQLAQVSVLLKDEDDLVLLAHHGTLTARAQEGAHFPSNIGPCGRAIASTKTVVENDLVRSGKHLALYAESASRMCIPLVSFGQLLGVLVIDDSQINAFRNFETQPLESAADICATAIQNAYHVERVKDLAYRDGLTGIFNRRFFEMRIGEEIERARRFSHLLSVIMIDIDHFKRLNDDFGHLMGDEVLQQVSSVLGRQLRKIDVVCRYGGEEFAVLLAQTDTLHALRVAEKLRRAVESFLFVGVPRQVTISAGVGTCPDNGDTRDDLVKAADTALYAAKQAGRNRVCCSGKED